MTGSSHNGSRIAHLGQRIGWWLLACLLLALLLEGFLRAIVRRRQKTQRMIFLELTPPAFTGATIEETTSLLQALRRLHGADFLMNLLDRSYPLLSLEVVASRQQGIRYLMRLPAHNRASVQRLLRSYLPELEIHEVPDYLTNDVATTTIAPTVCNFVLRTSQLQSSEYGDGASDPIAYLAGSMTQLQDDELMALQLVLQPAGAATLTQVLLQSVRSIAVGCYAMVRASIRIAMNYQARTGHETHKRTNAATGTAIDSEGHFQATVRVLLLVAEPESRLQTIQAAMSLHSQGQQGFAVHRTVATAWLSAGSYADFQTRRSAWGYQATCRLSAVEIANLYHFPDTSVTPTENTVQLHSRSLPAPLSLKQSTTPDLVLGQNDYHGQRTVIGLSSGERERHVYIVGGTGNGKTTMIKQAVIQDIQNGKGVAVIDPHGDLAESLLRCIPEERLDDVIYFNPDDLSRPIGLNLLELPKGLDETDLLRETDRITETVVSLFRKTFSADDSGGHRIESVLRNAVHTALTVEGATLFTVFRLLTDLRYRREVIQNLDDEQLKAFWYSEYDAGGSFQRVKMASGVTTKLGRYGRSAAARRVFEQPQSTINFDDILNSGKILICNFSKGLLGEDTAHLFGAAVLAKLQLAALRRARQTTADRRPFYLYVDEFQNFATVQFTELLSEARKYQLFLTMAEQSTAQQADGRLTQIILANVGTVVCFRTGSPDDEGLLLPLFEPAISRGEIAHLPSHHFFIRIATTSGIESFSGQTELVPEAGTAKTAIRAIQASRERYGRRPMAKKLALAGDDPKPQLPHRIPYRNGFKPTL